MSAGYIAVPSCPGASVRWWNYRTFDNGVRIIGMKWTGTAEALLTAGIVTEDMLKLKDGKRGRRDRDGERYRVDRYFRSRNGQPYRCYCILRWKSRETMLLVPGAREAFAVREEEEERERQSRHPAAATISATDRWQRSDQAQRAADRCEREPMRPKLRLVVNNTA